MTDSRRRYDDSYNPVIDIPAKHTHGDEIERPSDNRKEDNARAKGHRVSSRRRTSSSKKSDRKNDSAKTEQAESWWVRTKQALTSQTTRWIMGLILGAFAVYLGVSFVSYFAHCIADQAAIANSAVGSLPKVDNAGGEGGARIAEFLINEGFGLGSFVIILWLAAMSLKMLCGWPKFKTVNFTIKCIVALVTLSLIVGLVTISMNSPVNWGGFHGRYVNEFIIGFFGWSGAVILCILLIAIFIVICLRDLVNWVIRKRHEIAEKRRIAAEEKAEQLRRERELEEMRLQEARDAVNAGDAKAEIADEPVDDSLVKFGGDEVDIDPTLVGYEIDDEEAQSGLQLKGETESTAGYNLEDSDTETANGENKAAEAEAGERGDDAEKNGEEAAIEGEEPTDQMVVNVNQIATTDVKYDSGVTLIKRTYKFPSPMLLREGSQRISVDELEQQANKQRIQETLLYHGIPITNIEATVGPTVTLYEIRPEQGVKISKIKNLADDIALSLSAIGVRIIAPIPGKGTVGIEVANAEPQTVSMRTIIMSRKYNETRYRLPVALGSTIGNDVYIADLTKMPHLLVAGATGQGKSVGLNAIIASLLYKKRPDELKFVMIDPKEVEFSLYAKIEKHYLAKLEDSDAIVTDMSKVVATLSSLCVEMDNRYKLLRTAQVRNIEEYNAKIAQHLLDPREGHKFMPYIVLVVDEFADLIMTSGKEVETPIARLAQKARAIGIHVIIATQRPSTNVITGIIKANFPVRIAFKVSSGVDSKTILDATGAQSLIGKGDMLISNNSEMVRVQCAFIDTPEVEAICDYISRQPFNAGPYLLPEPQLAAEGEGGRGGAIDSERDPLFEEVAELVVQSGVGSTSGIQRRYSIGYNRAGKIMDQLESYGIVGPSLGGKPRQVLMGPSELQNFLDTLH